MTPGIRPKLMKMALEQVKKNARHLTDGELEGGQLVVRYLPPGDIC